MQPILNIAFKAARTAGDLISRAFEQFNDVNVEQKGQHDFVTDIDRQAEQIIIEAIHKTYPDHNILAEESGKTAHSSNGITWIIDPLDGTHNFIHGFPHFCISLAVQENGRTEHGLIYDPIKRDLFTASRGEGARCNSKRIRVTQRTQFEGAMIATGLSSYAMPRMDEYFKTLYAFTQLAGDGRRAGSAALDLAYIAAGRMDGYWEFNLKPWDIAAGALLVKEAGGLVSDLYGQEQYLVSGDIVAANPKLFKKMLQVIQQSR